MRDRKQSMASDWAASGDVFGTMLAGLLLGLGADWLFGTDPWFVVVGIILGFYAGFHRMYMESRKVAEHAVARSKACQNRPVADD